jgi:hypothetical protein
VVVTRRNDRTLRDQSGEPVRNRERWQVDAVHADGALTVTRHRGHGTVTLPADYVAAHVRLGYAATAHGHQGDTADVAYTLIDQASTHRGLYVGATRGRDENHLLVLTETPDDLAEARDTLERALTRDRADIPAIAQRRHLADALGGTPAAVRSLEDQLADAERRVRAARQRAEPYEAAVAAARAGLERAEHTLTERRAQLRAARPWARRAPKDAVTSAEAAVEAAREHHEDAVAAAAPARADLQQETEARDRLDRHAGVERARRQLDQLQHRPVQREALGR